jgi:guanylate kinase
VKQALPEGVLVFVRTASRDEQRRRLLARAHDSPEAIERRLAEAEKEERVAAEEFDYVVVNDDLVRAVDEVAGILADCRSGPR